MERPFHSLWNARSIRHAGKYIPLIICICTIFSCTQHYTPKPRGYFRIELPEPVYTTLSPDGIPCTFSISSLATADIPPETEASSGWINLSYPSLGATIYCSYLPVTPSTLEMAVDESRALVARQVKNGGRITQQAYENPQAGIYAMLYESGGDSAAPLQFTLTDSAEHFFRGALLYDRTAAADSLAPVMQYLKADVLELIQSFSWKK
ncbi:MAG: gliding motility protein GldD [Tannerellaceae bacterium]|jgi:gliding motility-associated lipoprotein GldD|nr:gliding motility protein GldD [Tannerellaceae bacterium]